MSKPTPDYEKEIRELKARVDGLERRELLTLQIINPIVDGVHLCRCKCGSFATRSYTIAHPRAGTEIQYLCDTCEVSHPFQSAPTTEIAEVPYGNPNAIQMSRDLNRRLANLWRPEVIS